MNSIIIHELNDYALTQFPDWFRRLEAALAAQPGFVAVRAFSDAAAPSRRVLILEMQSEAALRAWVEGEAKHELLQELEAAAVRPWTALRLRPI